MKRVVTWCRSVSLAVSIAAVIAVAARPGTTTVSAAGFVVNSAGDTSDAVPGDGICLGVTSTCTFRAAIEESNALGGTNTITFAIPTVGSLKTLTPASSLPAITSPVTIDGTTQISGGFPGIELDGTSAGVSGVGLEVDPGGDGSTIEGVVINRFAVAGIVLKSDNNHVDNTVIGLNPSGSAVEGNGTGIVIRDGSNNQIGRPIGNTISGNGNGIEIVGVTKTTTGNVIKHNAIGMEPVTGLVDRGNTQQGVWVHAGGAQTTFNHIGVFNDGNTISGNDANGVLISGGASNNVVERNGIGVNIPGAGAIPNGASGVRIDASPNNTVGGPGSSPSDNLISGNTLNGVTIVGAASAGNRIQGNGIGTNVPGTSALANGGDGVLIDGAPYNLIGGAGYGNLISGNGGSGIEMLNGGAIANTVQGNLIGTNGAGTAAIANGSYGIRLSNGANNNLIGGFAPSATGNLISGNGLSGIDLANVSGNGIFGVAIGTNLSLTAGIPNGNHGILIESGSTDNVVGSVSPGGGTLIAFNTADGVRIDGAATLRNAVRANAIFGDGGKGIATTNGGDAMIAPPVVLSARTGTACANCGVDVFSDIAGQDQGRVYLGSTTADGAGNWSFAGSVPGPVVTATATTAAGNTSEFSPTPFLVNLTTIAGDPGGMAGYADGPGSTALLHDPRGVFETSTGVIYFADRVNNVIRRIDIDANRTVSTVAGGGGTYCNNCSALSTTLSVPEDVFVDAGGDIYIADTGDCQVRKVHAGTITLVAGAGPCDYNGEGTATSAHLNSPSGVAVDASGRVLIADRANNRARLVSSGVISTVAGGGGGFCDNCPAGSTSLSSPTDVYFGFGGFYDVADTANNLIRKVNVATGVINTVAGGGGGYCDNCPGTSSTLNMPSAIAEDTAGNLFIADTGDNAIRRLSHNNGTITAVTFCSGGGCPGSTTFVASPYGVGVGDVVLSTQNQIRAVQGQSDPTTGETAASSRPSTFCREGFSKPLAAVGDWGVILLTLGLVAGHRRFRRFLLVLRQRLRGAPLVMSRSRPV